ncbi:hypothetical protein D4Q52_17085 [Rhodopseudomonas palustris]|uniref:Uncharacterized protein n=1 Tax=Rhodopseudomonas palustris TaxID=1076 RepID=A0A418V386_RHOPL|nr:hypothetical protein D4Q52_17085 [Rhodopseudomonas palustris]
MRVTLASPRHGRACPGHPRLFCVVVSKAWMPGTRPGMTGGEVVPHCDRSVRSRQRSRRLRRPGRRHGAAAAGGGLGGGGAFAERRLGNFADAGE